ncbi:DUF5995 family protein [Actinomadura kijaniata]|uniref:Uncharacterized protein n=1 Tax=Actinomadura namibiensis TaxID=182080 RepID=A0A7W3LU85_ACTNM|nr:DUF5995 family protein [Actinomadura namibiensis]MBA8954302.1 hypothetical protein [Actinomadura namibiensis]
MSTITDVIDRMREIDRGLDPHDGVACFNRVYLKVTERIAHELTTGLFADPPFVERLDVDFAGFYLAAVDAAVAGRPARPWRPLFAARADRSVWSLQFALAGMNAHINHDLALAVITTCTDTGRDPDDDPIHHDFLRINEILEDVESEVRRSLEPALLKLATKDAETLKHIVGTFCVARARDLSWCSLQTLWPQRGHPFLYDNSVALLAQTVSVMGRLLVTPVTDVPDLWDLDGD